MLLRYLVAVDVPEYLVFNRQPLSHIEMTRSIIFQ